MKPEENKEESKASEPKIPWIEKFDQMKREAAESPNPDIDFITRLHELEGR